MKTVAIIGGGAAGCIAAVELSKSKEIKVVLIEKQQRILRKVSATGNGRCNLTNTGACAENYHGKNPGFVNYALNKYPAAYIVDYFKALGLITTEEFGGRVYPLSNSANSVIDVIRYALESSSVEIITSMEVSAIKPKKTGFEILTNNGVFRADSVIYSCGGAAGEKLGGSKTVYKPLENIGLKIIHPIPSLVQLTSDSPYPKMLKGVKADVNLKYKNADLSRNSNGELLFTDKGISGPVTFDISSSVSRALDRGERAELSINMFPGYDYISAYNTLEARCRLTPNLPASELFTGIVHNRLGRILVKYSEIDANKELSMLTNTDLKKATDSLSNFKINITGTEGFGNAQITAGGVEVGQIDEQTMECRSIPKLYLCGEILDIDGDCGGYNLQWAWASGLLAANSIIEQ